MSGEQVEEVAADRLGAAVFEQRRLSHMLRQRGAEITSLTEARDRLASKLARLEQGAAEERERAARRLEEARTQLSSLTANRDRMAVELKQAEYEVRRSERRLARTAREADEAARETAKTARDVEESARDLGRVQHEVELLVELEKEREVLLANSERTLGEVVDHLRRVRASRSWRWGHRIAQALRALSFRRRSKRSALDNALERLGADEDEAGADEHRT